MANHDEFFRKGFENPEVAAAFCEHFLDPEVLDLVDLDRVNIEKDTFVDKRLRKSYSDLLLSLPLRGAAENDKQRLVQIYVLIEHKSSSDRWAILQLLGYMVDIWKREVNTAEEPAQLELPLIIPIILHHGEGVFGQPIEFSKLFAEMLRAFPFVPRFEARLVDLSSIPPEDLPDSDARLYAILSVMQAIFDETIGERTRDAVERLREVIHKSGVPELIEAIITYVSQSATGLSDDDAAVLNEVKNSDGESIMSTLAERWFAQGEAKGEAKGEARGEARGEVKGKTESIFEILLDRFSAVPEDIEATIRQVSDLECLKGLLSHAMHCRDLDEFRHVLADPGRPR